MIGFYKVFNKIRNSYVIQDASALMALVCFIGFVIMVMGKWA